MKNLFKFLFTSPITPEQTVEKIQVDIHSHLIPALDDGAQNLEESITLIRGLIQLGYKKIITTPHIQFSQYTNSIETIRPAYEQLINALHIYNINIPIEFAAEYMLDEGFSKHLKQGLLSFSKHQYVLIETSHYIKPDRFREIIFDIQMKGYKPVFAHPERYSYLWNNKDDYFQLKDLGLYFQLNLNSLTGYYTEKPLSIGKFLLKNQLIDFVGSDTHHERHIQMLHKSLVNEYIDDYLKTGKLLNASLINS